MGPDDDEVIAAAVMTDHVRFGNYFTVRDVATNLNARRRECDHITEDQIARVLDGLVQAHRLERCFDGVTWGVEDAELRTEVPALYRLARP